MGRMSREKGKRFERQVAALFREEGFTDAQRSAQVMGKTGQAADVIGVDGIHIECKAQERMCLYDWMEQAVRDSQAGQGDFPVVVHKQNNKDILVTMRWSEWIELFREWSNGLWRDG